MSNLFEDLKGLTDHEVALATKPIRRRHLPPRDCHPVADQFPISSEANYASLLADIRANGQREPIALYQGAIWDGRSRYSACAELGLVPKVFVLRREPVVYLLRRHRDRYGLPSTPERTDALALFDRLHHEEFKAERAKLKSEWLATERKEFAQYARDVPQRCAVCGLNAEYSQAHHRLPLSLQYDLGVVLANHDHDWLCAVHHKLIHTYISSYLLGSRYNEGPDYAYRYADEAARSNAEAAVVATFARTYQLYLDLGGVPARAFRGSTP